VIPNMAEQFRLAVTLWTCILEVRGSKLDSIDVQAVLNEIVHGFSVSKGETG
jgi:hypothetical protein